MLDELKVNEDDDAFARMHAGIIDAFGQFLEDIGPDSGQQQLDVLEERLEQAVHTCPLPTLMCQHILDALSSAARAIHQSAPRAIGNFANLKRAR